MWAADEILRFFRKRRRRWGRGRGRGKAGGRKQKKRGREGRKSVCMLVCVCLCLYTQLTQGELLRNSVNERTADSNLLSQVHLGECGQINLQYLEL